MSAVLEAREPSARYLECRAAIAGAGSSSLLATAPGGVARLRELILTLAVQGQAGARRIQRDTPASELIRRVRHEKETLVAAGKVKSIRPLSSFSESEEPYSLPRGWAFCRLGDLLLSIRSGGTPSKQNPKFWDGDIPWASVKDLRFGEPITHTQDRITKEGLAAGSELAPAGSILICTRMGLGKIGEALIDVAINQDLKAVLLGSGVVKSYFIYYFKTLAVVGSGMTVAGIRQDELLDFVVPVPPQAEQARIVARVDELMRLCDALEAKGRLEAEQHARLLGTLLRTLTDSSTPEELAANWRRVSDHFDLLLDRREAVDALEQTILQLAVRGLLVPQDFQDEPASELLKTIRTEKTRLIAEGKIKRDKPLPPIAEDEKPFELPKGWAWVRLRDMVTHLGDGLHGTPNYSPKGAYYFVNGNNLRDGAIVIKPETKRVDKSEFEKYKKPLDATTVLLSINGTLGNVAFFCGEHVVLGKSACYFNLTSGLAKSFIRTLLECPDFQGYATARATGSTIKNLGLKAIGDWPIALPPLAEQSRIVTRVAQLRRLCAELRQRLDCSGAMQTAFADALVDQALVA